MSAATQRAVPNNKMAASDCYEENPRPRVVKPEKRPTFEELKKIEKLRRNFTPGK